MEPRTQAAAEGAEAVPLCTVSLTLWRLADRLLLTLSGRQALLRLYLGARRARARMVQPQLAEGAVRGQSVLTWSGKPLLAVRVRMAAAAREAEAVARREDLEKSV